LLDEDRLSELAVEKRRLDVKVVDAPILRCGHSQQQANGLHSCHRSKDYLKVDALTLHKATGNKLGLVLGNGAALIPLHHVDPLFSPIGLQPAGSSTNS